MENSMEGGSQKLKIVLPYDPAMPLLGIYLNKLYTCLNETHTHTHISPFFIMLLYPWIHISSSLSLTHTPITYLISPTFTTLMPRDDERGWCLFHYPCDSCVPYWDGALQNSHTCHTCTHAYMCPPHGLKLDPPAVHQQGYRYHAMVMNSVFVV